MTNTLSFTKFKTLIFFCLFVVLCGFSFAQPLNEGFQIDATQKSQKNTTIPNLKVSAQVGYGYRFANSLYTAESAMYKHLKKLKNSLSFGADFSYYFTNNIGIGIKYNSISSHVVTNDLRYTFSNGNKENAKQVSEYIETHFVGAFLATQFFLVPNKHSIFANVGAGFIRYKNNIMLNSREVSNIDNSAAFFGEIGYDFFITKSFAIGLQISTLIELTNGLSDPESMSHIDFSLGFKFYNQFRTK